jgi:hypothetical protein
MLIQVALRNLQMVVKQATKEGPVVDGGAEITALMKIVWRKTRPV